MKEFVNPRNSSFVEQNLQIKKGEITDVSSIYNRGKREGIVYHEENTGEGFFPVTRNPEMQRLVSSLVKGIVNVSDIVHKDGVHFSHKQNLEHVPPNDDYLEEIEADRLILKYVFGDFDHAYYSNEDAQLKGFMKEKGYADDDMARTSIEHRNLVVNHERKSSYFFDFDAAGSPGLDFGEGIHSLQIGGRVTEHNLKVLMWNSFIEEVRNGSGHFLTAGKILSEKSAVLQETVFGPDGFERFSGLVKRAGVKFKERAFDFYSFNSEDQDARERQLFEDLRKRCQIMHEVANEVVQASQ